MHRTSSLLSISRTCSSRRASNAARALAADGWSLLCRRTEKLAAPDSNSSTRSGSRRACPGRDGEAFHGTSFTPPGTEMPNPETETRPAENSCCSC